MRKIRRNVAGYRFVYATALAAMLAVALTTCNPSNDAFGQILSASPREIRLGFKFCW